MSLHKISVDYEEEAINEKDLIYCGFDRYIDKAGRVLDQSDDGYLVPDESLQTQAEQRFVLRHTSK